MTAPTPQFIQSAQAAQRAQQQQAAANAIPTQMLQSLGSLLEIPLRAEDISQVSQFQNWATNVLRKISEMGRGIVTTRTGVTAWGVALCETFLAHVTQLPSRLRGLFSSVQRSTDELNRYAANLNNPVPAEKLLQLLDGFSTAIQLFLLTNQASAVDTKEIPKDFPKNGPLLPDELLQSLLRDAQAIKKTFLGVDPLAIADLSTSIKEAMAARKSMPRANGPLPIIPFRRSPGGGSGITVGPSTSPLLQSFQNNSPFMEWVINCSMPLFAWTIFNSSTSVVRLSAQLQEVITAVTILTKYYNVFGQCLSELLQSYQSSWVEFTQSPASDLDKKDAEMSLIQTLSADPDLAKALQSSGVKMTQLTAWVDSETQNQCLQNLSASYSQSVKAVKAAWDKADFNAQLDIVKNDLCELPDCISSKWIQNAWQYTVSLQDQIAKVGTAIGALDATTQ